MQYTTLPEYRQSVMFDESQSASLVYDGSPPCHRVAGPTERAAAEAMAGACATYRKWVLAAARRIGGLTVKEAVRLYVAEFGVDAADLGTLRNTIGPRLTELRHGGFVTIHPTLRREGCGVYLPTDKIGDGSTCERGVRP